MDKDNTDDVSFEEFFGVTEEEKDSFFKAVELVTIDKERDGDCDTKVTEEDDIMELMAEQSMGVTDTEKEVIDERMSDIEDDSKTHDIEELIEDIGEDDLVGEEEINEMIEEDLPDYDMEEVMDGEEVERMVEEESEEGC